MQTVTSTPLTDDQALAGLASLPADARVVVDFDETLFLTNSTLLYLDGVRPRWLVWMIFKLVGLLFRVLPARLALWRDACTVSAVTVLCPWALGAWKRNAAKVGAQYANVPLARALLAGCKPSQVQVCSFGMDFLIRPLLAPLWATVCDPHSDMAANWRAVPLVASQWHTAGADRMMGKPAMLAQRGFAPPALGQPLVVVTDSLDDRALLEQATHPFLVQWAAVHAVSLFRGVYLPLRYAHALRHPTLNFVFRVVLYEEWLGLCLVFAPAVWATPMSALGLLFLVLSFWVVYEQGYAENDRIAVHLEGKQPTVEESARFSAAQNSHEPLAWCWAFALGGAGVALLDTDQGFGLGMLLWMASLLGLRLTYWVYNHLNPSARVWLYPALQLWKMLPVALMLPLNSVGVCFVVACTVSRWFPYWVYRAGGQRKGFPELALRAVLLICALLIEGALMRATPFEWAQAGLMVVYMLRRSRHELRKASRDFVWLRAAPKQDN